MSADDAMDVDATPYLDRDPTLPLLPPAPAPAPAASPAPDTAASIYHARRAVLAFLQARTALDIIPPHSRVLIIDADLRLNHAFRALLDNGVRAAPVMDLSRHEFCGMLSVSDILHSLLHLYYSHPTDDEHFNLCPELQTFTARRWLHHRLPVNDASPTAPAARAHFYAASGDAPLLQAVRLMRDRVLTHIPVLDQRGTLLHTLEHWRVLRYVHRHLSGGGGAGAAAGAAHLFDLTVGELGIGTHGELVSVRKETSVLCCLQTLQRHALSAVPVVDARGRLVEVYSRADTVGLASGRCDGFTLRREVGAVLQELRGGVPFRGATCAKGDVLGGLFERLEETGVQRLYVVEEDVDGVDGEDGGIVTGVVALSDLLRYFLCGY